MGYMGIVIAATKLLVVDPKPPDLQSRLKNLMVVGFFQIMDRAWLSFFFLDVGSGVCLTVVQFLPSVCKCPAVA